MNKKNNLALFTLLVIGLTSSLTLNLPAQNKVSVENNQSTKKCSGEKFVMPPSISVGNDAFTNYLKVASLPMKERRLLFSQQSSEQKASFFKVNLALQLVKRPEINAEQRAFILDLMSKASADVYDKSDPEKTALREQVFNELISKAFGLFSQRDAGDFVEGLNTNKDKEVVLVQNYQGLLKNGMNARKSIVRELPMNDRANIWKTQLAYHLATGKFSKVQKEFIAETMTSLSETLASRASMTQEEKDKAGETLQSNIFGLFTKEEGYAIFMTVGIQNSIDEVPIDVKPATCDCNLYCSDGNQSCGDANGCMSSSDGCGPFGWLGCHSKCRV